MWEEGEAAEMEYTAQLERQALHRMVQSIDVGGLRATERTMWQQVDKL